MLKLHPVSGGGRFFAKSSVSLLFLSLGVLGCAGSNYVTVRVPPEVDLRSYEAVGIIEFGSNADAAISRYATERFQSSVQSAQPGTRLIELGTAESVLAADWKRSVVRGDMFARLVETKTAAGVWSNSSWVTRQLGGVHLSSDGGISGTVQRTNPREEMVPALVREVTTGLRESTARRRVD